MTQSADLSLANQSRSAFRTELNSIIAALASAHKGDTAPSYAVAGMDWVDDSASPWVWKKYDGADWIVWGKLDPTGNLFRLAEQGAANELSGVPTVEQLQNNSALYVPTGGSANAYTFDLGVGLRPSAYVAGQEFLAKLNFANTGNATFNVTGAAGTGLGAKSIKLMDGSNPPAAMLANNMHARLRYDGTNMVLVSMQPFVTSSQIKSGTATAGKVLKADGSGGSSFDDVASGAGDLLSAVTAANSAAISFISGIDTTYDEYEVHVQNMVPATNGVIPQVLFGIAGPTYRTSDYEYAADQPLSSGFPQTYGSTGGSQIDLVNGNDVKNDAGIGFSGVIRVMSPADPATKTSFLVDGTYRVNNGGTNVARLSLGGSHNVAEAIVALRFKFSAGDIASGKFKLYGVRKS